MNIQNFTVNVTKECIRNKLSFRQFMFLCLLYGETEKEKKVNLEILAHYCDTIAVWSKEELFDLEEKDFVLNMNVEGQYWTDMFLTTEKTDKLFKKINKKFDPTPSEQEEIVYEQFQELFDTYPVTIAMGEKRFPAKTVSPEDDELIALYKKNLKKSEYNHEEVIKKLKFQKENNLLYCGLLKYVQSMGWTNDEKPDTHNYNKLL